MSWFSSIDKKPNKKEIILIKLLQVILSNEYEYVGDGKILIDSYVPDFININGQKKIIEHFGDYWHANPEKYKPNDVVYRNLKAKKIWIKNKQRVNTYSKYGYKTLVIWENELKNLDKVKEKVLHFNLSV